jgi:ATP-dependent DNA helicase RecG
MAGFFESKIEFLKGVGPNRAALLNKELGIFTFGDLIQHYPFRYEDRTKFHTVSELDSSLPYIQLKGYVRGYQLAGKPRKQHLTVHFYDETGDTTLIWFQGIKWIIQKLNKDTEYVVFGKPTLYNNEVTLAHPEFEPFIGSKENMQGLFPVYSTTETLRAKYLGSKGLSKLLHVLVENSIPHLRETLPIAILQKYKLAGKSHAIKNIHFPDTVHDLEKARFRLKFEEFFYIQLKLLKMKVARLNKFRGHILNDTQMLTEFYNEHIPFKLTEAQKKVMREIYQDVKSGHQMNRLLQGDVGSGKTMVAFLAMLLAVGNDTQAALMAPTEILSEQHYNNLKVYADKLQITIALLTGSTKKAERKKILAGLEDGSLNILVGTHALIVETVEFKKLGLAVIDEQHRFGVAQRAKLWEKNTDTFPHVLVMTATPIPRTLAMTLYGDLDVSVIDEMPGGRKPIKTYVQFDSQRLKLFGFMKKQIREGRQVYIVYPLIDESEKMDLKHLLDGYESIQRAFPEYKTSIVHGRQKPVDKELEMKRFVKGETQIMMSTTVIEVGINVPNASVMVIENAERFGLAQLHQLRGRVGRGADQSYCILMTKPRISQDARKRLETMVRTNNGFEIADIDLQLRGPGDLSGTQQSGALDLLIGDLGTDSHILRIAREAASEILTKDADLVADENRSIKIQIDSLGKNIINWSRIS